MDPRSRWIRIDGDRRLARAALDEDAPDDAVAAFDFLEPARVPKTLVENDVVLLGDEPRLVRPLRASVFPILSRAPGIPLLSPVSSSRRRRPGVREITAHEPRMTRLWERFSIDIGVAVERSAAFLSERAFGRAGPKHRVLVFEDGDRYAMRALCMFTSEDALQADALGRRFGTVLELLHDRSVTGMRAASHLLGLAVREMSGAGADAVTAWSLPHSGGFPMFLRHGFVPLPKRLAQRPLRTFAVAPLEPELAPLLVRREHWYLSSLDDPSV